jgi:hypothetical protein
LYEQYFADQEKTENRLLSKFISELEASGFASVLVSATYRVSVPVANALFLIFCSLEYEDFVFKKYAAILELFRKLLLTKWDTRFDQVEVVVLTDLNSVLAHIARIPSIYPRLLVCSPSRVSCLRRSRSSHLTFLFLMIQPLVDPRVVRSTPVDIRVLVRWDTDNSDVELHVTEPSGEKCFSFHNLTRAGGLLSKDMSGGYGPEEYVIRNAEPGSYQVSVKMFSHIVNPFVPPVCHSLGRNLIIEINRERFHRHRVTVSVEVTTDCGRAEHERRQVSVVRLDKPKQVISVFKVNVNT